MVDVAERVLPAAASSVPASRRFVREALAHERYAELRDPAELATSELATNAVVHAGTDFVVRVATAASGVRIEVGDGSPHIPSARSYAATARTGRGLQMVDESVHRWGITPTANGKVVWFELGQVEPQAGWPTAPAALSDDLPPVLEVRLVDVPLLMHHAWQEHAQALLREYLLLRLDDDPSVLDQHAEASDALAVLYEQVPRPRLPDDADALLAEALEPAVTRAELTIQVPVPTVEHFATLDLLLRRAVEAAEAGVFLGPPTQPEIAEMREWFCEEVARQVHGRREPRPWRTRADLRTATADPEVLLQEYAALTDAAEHVLVSDEASVIVAVSPSVARFLGYDHTDDLLGRRTIAVIPARYHQAHIAGTTLHATNGRDTLLGVRITVPLVRADGTEAMVGLRVTPRTLGATRVFAADMELLEELD